MKSHWQLQIRRHHHDGVMAVSCVTVMMVSDEGCTTARGFNVFKFHAKYFKLDVY
jgi:hypothetical protein